MSELWHEPIAHDGSKEAFSSAYAVLGRKTTNMSSQSESISGRTALVIGHSAGMMDLVALPVWVGIVLVGHMGLDPQRAGALATLFLISVVASSLFFVPRLNRLRRERAAPVAYGLAGLVFASMIGIGDYTLLAMANVAAGLAVGCGLSLTLGTMGESTNPHRLAAIAFTLLSLLAIVFLAAVPPLVQRFGPSAFFIVRGGLLLAAALAALFAFPSNRISVTLSSQTRPRLPGRVWFGMAGVSLMMLNQSMIAGFVERIGTWNGFDSAMVAGALIATGVVNLFPAVLAGLLEHRWSAARVVCAGPLFQAVLCLIVALAPGFWAYAIALSLFIGLVTFTQVFAFGFLARLDPSGRAVAATPVMVMTGAAAGPLLGGMLAQHMGHESLGWTALLVGILSAASYRLAAGDEFSTWSPKVAAREQG